MVETCFIHCHISTKKLLLIHLNISKNWSVSSTHWFWSKYFVMDTFNDIFGVSAISYNFSLQAFYIILEIFLMFSRLI